ncbi:hypothetical protein [Aureimonas mangrovi]|uniref:hypothetical protein n=1 Tax=Aureimonas mangrovi TaxID=2758041 RepID=UPI00163DBF75|nr:hypothetical protein [Aureimonas mangrovi]
MRLLIAAFFLLVLPAAAFACPDPSQYGSTHRFSGSELYSEKTFRVRAGGDTSIQRCKNVAPGTDDGQGYVMSKPDFSFNLSGMSGYTLTVSVKSECDSVLLINTASENWFYDDDDAGNLDAKINLTRPANGWLDIWVGTHDGSYCDAVLSLETFNR